MVDPFPDPVSHFLAPGGYFGFFAARLVFKSWARGQKGQENFPSKYCYLLVIVVAENQHTVVVNGHERLTW